MNDAIQAIRAWRKETIREGDLWRRLLAYERWLVPRRPDGDATDADAPDGARFTLSQAALAPDPTGGSRLILFSDARAVKAFTKQALRKRDPAYLTPTGWHVFTADLGDITGVVVDPGAPHEYVIPRASFESVRELAAAMEVDAAWQRLRRGAEEPTDLALVAHYPHYLMVAIESEAGLVSITVPYAEGGAFLPVFTHRYPLALAMADFRLSFPGKKIETAEVRGARLFPALAQEEADGVVFNYLGPGEPAAFRAGILDVLLETLAASEAQTNGASPHADGDGSADEPAATVADADAPPVVRALLAFKSDAISDEELFRAILDHETWYVPVTESSHALLWEVGGTNYVVAMHEEVGPYGQEQILLPMGARHLLNNIPDDVQAIAFDLGFPQALGLEMDEGQGMLDALIEQAAAGDVEALLVDPSRGDSALFLGHDWLFLARDGVPSVESYGGRRAICLFTTGSALRHFLAKEPAFADSDVQRASGHDLFAHLAERTDFDAIWMNPGRRTVWAPFEPSISADLLAGRDPRRQRRHAPPTAPESDR